MNKERTHPSPGFEVSTAEEFNSLVFWYMTTCSLIKLYQRSWER